MNNAVALGFNTRSETTKEPTAAIAEKSMAIPSQKAAKSVIHKTQTSRFESTLLADLYLCMMHA
eukprot:scaffold3084_cov144-Cylindrotheca_fusiformis.AAC.18